MIGTPPIQPPILILEPEDTTSSCGLTDRTDSTGSSLEKK